MVGGLTKAELLIGDGTHLLRTKVFSRSDQNFHLLLCRCSSEVSCVNLTKIISDLNHAHSML